MSVTRFEVGKTYESNYTDKHITIVWLGKVVSDGQYAGTEDGVASHYIFANWTEVVPQRRWEFVTEWRAPKKGEPFVEPTSMTYARFYTAAIDFATDDERHVIVSTREITDTPAPDGTGGVA